MIKYMDIKEFVDGGYLQEVNRNFFHPLGLALEVRLDDDRNYFISGVWDYRDDPEGIRFADGVDLKPKADKIWQEMVKRYTERFARLGYIKQPAE